MNGLQDRRLTRAIRAMDECHRTCKIYRFVLVGQEALYADAEDIARTHVHDWVPVNSNKVLHILVLAMSELLVLWRQLRMPVVVVGRLWCELYTSATGLPNIHSNLY